MRKKRRIWVFQRHPFICQVRVSWLINIVLSWMEWGNCHLDPMSCSEKAQLVGVVEGAPWQSYTNSILSFCCAFFPGSRLYLIVRGLELFQLFDCQQSIQQIIYLQYSWSWKQAGSEKLARLYKTRPWWHKWDISLKAIQCNAEPVNQRRL